jgi:hypothetical protein
MIAGNNATRGSVMMQMIKRTEYARELASHEWHSQRGECSGG